MSSTPSLNSRIKGSLLGVAVVDALGGPAEFKQRGTFPLVDSFVANDNFELAAGTWTDDTSMTLCLAQSIIDSNGAFHIQDQIIKYLQWYQHGYLSATDTCFDIGNATRSSLRIWADFLTHEPRLDPRSPEPHTEGQKIVDRHCKKAVVRGNGSLMRVAPVALRFHEDMALAERYAALSSAPTHPYPTNGEACALYTRLIVLALHGRTKAQLVAEFAAYDIQDADLRQRVGGYRTLADWRGKAVGGISSSGYVVHTLEASLWAFFSTESFREGAVRAVNLGDDADTVGAIYGGLAGAFYGLDEIPGEWRSGLVRFGVVDRIATDLAALTS